MRKNKVIILGVLLLVACGKQKPSVANLSPQEVLERASQATRNLRSAEYALTSEFDAANESMSVNGTATVNGVLTDSGKQLHFLSEFSGFLSDASESQITLDGALEVAVIDKNEVYINLHSLSIQPEIPLFSPSVLKAFIGQWWQVPGSDVRQPAISEVTPEPSLLRAQAEVVTITSDMGAEMLDGQSAYHYAVAVDSGKLLNYMETLAKESGTAFNAKAAELQIKNFAATGELWIDATTFHLKKSTWVLQNLRSTFAPGGELNVKFTVLLHSQNADLEVSPPEGAKLYDPAMILNSAIAPENMGSIPVEGTSETNDLSFPFYPDSEL